jgi:hypothetical protein
MDGQQTKLLKCRIEIGEKLKELKQSIPHGKWEDALKSAGTNPRTAERLMQIAGSPLAAQIRTIGTVLAARLPDELQKLCMLARLSIEQLEAVIEQQDLCELTRAELAAEVKRQLGQAAPESDEPEETEATADPEESATPADITGGGTPTLAMTTTPHRTPREGPPHDTDETVVTDDDGTETETSTQSAGVNPRDLAAAHEKRCRQLLKFRQAEYLTFEVGTPEATAIDELTQIIAALALKTGGKLLTKAMKIANYDSTMVAMALCANLKDTLNPEEMFRP